MKVSVVILTFNRKKDVLFSLRKYMLQTHADLEFIVTDNGSTDGTREAVLSEFPEVKYIMLPENYDLRGYIFGIREASGELIWRCDSDSVPESDTAFEEMVAVMEQRPEISVIATDNIEVNAGYVSSEWYPLTVDKANVPPEGYKSHTFHGTGAMIRKKVFDEIGGFWGFGFEEYDFSIRAIMSGYQIRYFPNFKTLHYASPGERNRLRNHLMISTQLAKLTVKYFPGFEAFKRFWFLFIFQTLSAIVGRMPVLFWFETAFSMLTAGLTALRSDRTPIDKARLDDITLGVPVSRVFRDYIKMKIASRKNRSEK